MLEHVLKERLKSIDGAGLRRKLENYTLHESIAGRRVHTDHEEELLSFSCDDYMGLSTHELVKQAATDAVNLYGVGARASRISTGNHTMYAELEEKLAKMHNTESALVFSSGYLATIGCISSLVGHRDMILTDRMAHPSLLDGAKLCGAEIYQFDHNDVTHCDKLMNQYRKSHENCLLLVENVYGMSGNIAPVAELHALAKHWNSWIAIDTAHGFGMFSTQQPDVYIGTLSKTLGSLGGYICGSKTVTEYLLNTANSLVGTTALPPSVVAAASTALDLCQSQLGIPIRFAREFCQTLELPEPQSHIVTLIMKTNQSALNAVQSLVRNGMLVSAICTPIVPSPRLRFAFTATHKLIDIHRLCSVLKREGILSDCIVSS
ncbi:aminotransferase class I/II-fold pyridoxal phosphate-dependent enzyme [Candidatus Anaplasma sp. TIGMIC]|uniref:aminotransferase class I/II-fold pyridoxal phosphate-dependent enzyme n=1 Tax=Candidatus Anaplasma sp. TIGMIC TaxID=3020713 RepID=UPI00232FFC2F|nr:aminotransferase class I/II-fold pyridoxal phosphate-dependent enzyme [Candidatus Anaplasma sp. TIGMIC]MDB1135362.1 aminotransferase class I/II-fold pyridoxal phosphate-dependent enzyme [Candidatus Anaplasma sp. TIGMIC]